MGGRSGRPGRATGGRGDVNPARAQVAAVYVHAPVCAQRCTYCDFAVHVRRDGDAATWLAALAGELAAVRSEGAFNLAPALDTLYVGGGTPSLMGAEAMADLAGILGHDRVDHGALEWTAEANPEDVTRDLMRGWRSSGVNRLSIGAQTFHDRSLRWLGRAHGPTATPRAVDAARGVGIDNVNIDLLFGLPGRLGRPWRDDLRRTLDLEPTHVSVYGLSVEPGTPLGRSVAEAREDAPDEGRYRAEFLEAAETLTGAGYEHYEVSSFARPGFRTRHNAAYWEGTPYLGLGNSAHSHMPPLRRWNLRAWEAYSSLACAGRLPEEGREVLTGAARLMEDVWLGLRTDRGIPAGGLDPGGRVTVDRWVARGLAVEENCRVRLTPTGWLLLDSLVVELVEAGSG